MNIPRAIVVGAGPAGCAAAYTLAKKSINVTVLEQGRPGKDKTCGDALLPSAIELISIFGINQDRLKVLGGYHSDRVSIYIDNLLVRQSIYKHESGWVIPRAVIDQAIRDITAKYASFQYETCVTDLIIKPPGDLQLSLRHQDGTGDQVECDAVILATGSANRLSKKLDISGRPNRAFALSVYAEIPPANVHTFQFVDSRSRIYWWIFPISEKIANLGVCVLDEKLKVDIKLLAENFIKERRAHPLGSWRGGWGPLWSGLGQRWHHPAGVISCGDAAGLINPHTGEGMTAALRSGKQAGEAISNYLSGNRNPATLKQYSRWIIEHFSQQYTLTTSLQNWHNLYDTHL
jgi:geranylgeranyl reductase family protein